MILEAGVAAAVQALVEGRRGHDVTIELLKIHAMLNAATRAYRNTSQATRGDGTSSDGGCTLR
jgi:hypothetical protein